MDSYRKSAIIAGVFYILATIAGITSAVFGPDLETPDLLVKLSVNDNRVIAGALLEFTMAAMIVCISIYIYPILKEHNESLAAGYVLFRTIEAVILILCAISLLTLLTLSLEFVNSDTSVASCFQTQAALLIAFREWGGGVFSAIVFSLSTLILNGLLYSYLIIPRWLSIWGLIGAILYLGSGFMPLIGYGPRSSVYMIMEAPLGLWEMFFAVWLIVRGFKLYESTSGNSTLNK